PRRRLFSPLAARGRGRAGRAAARRGLARQPLRPQPRGLVALRLLLGAIVGHRLAGVALLLLFLEQFRLRPLLGVIGILARRQARAPCSCASWLAAVAARLRRAPRSVLLHQLVEPLVMPDHALQPAV